MVMIFELVFKYQAAILILQLLPMKFQVRTGLPVVEL